MQGYVKDYRKELQSDIWLMPPLYHRVWQYLKYKVNHAPNKIPMKDGTFFNIGPGQHLTSIRNIAQGVGYYEGLKWKEPNPKTISTIIDWLEKQEMIEVDKGKGNRQYTLITVLNWDSYQGEKQEGNSKETVDGEGSKQFADINKNDKECSKNDEEIYSVFQHWQSKDIIKHKKLNQKTKNAIKNAIKDYSYEEVIQAINNYTVAYKSDDYYFSYKYNLIDLMRDKDMRKFVDAADPLTNFKKRKVQKEKPYEAPQWESNSIDAGDLFR